MSSIASGTVTEGTQLCTRLVDFLKAAGVTGLYTDLTNAGTAESQTGAGVSSLMDTWLLVRELEANGERNRGLYILKSRGMAHSNQIREFLMTARGIELRDVYVGPEGVFAGSSRITQEAKERASALAARQDLDSQSRQLRRKRRTLQAQVEALRTEFAAEEVEFKRRIAEAKDREGQLGRTRTEQAVSRGSSPTGTNDNGARSRSGRKRQRTRVSP
jgi:circadian clock protein KaiC